MKLHIECLQEKLDQINVDKEQFTKEKERVKEESLLEVEKIKKIVITLEEELTAKVEKFKLLEK